MQVCAADRAANPLADCDSRLVALEQYWRKIHPAGGLPGRQHFDPLDLPPRVLPWLILIDVARAPLRFLYRLIGTAHVDALGYDPTGRWYDEVHANFPESTAYREFAAVVEQARPNFFRGPLTFVRTREHLEIERLTLPLARDGKTVDMLLCVAVHLPARPQQNATEATPRR